MFRFNKFVFVETYLWFWWTNEADFEGWILWAYMFSSSWSYHTRSYHCHIIFFLIHFHFDSQTKQWDQYSKWHKYITMIDSKLFKCQFLSTEWCMYPAGYPAGTWYIYITIYKSGMSSMSCKCRKGKHCNKFIYFVVIWNHYFTLISPWPHSYHEYSNFHRYVD